MSNRRLRVAACAVSLVAVASTTACADSASGSGRSWVGSLTLGGRVGLTLDIDGGRALVALGAGHAGIQSVALLQHGPRIRFQLRSRPEPLVFTGTRTGAAIRGTVRQGAAHGSFHVRRGEGRTEIAVGFYAGGGRRLAVVDELDSGARLVDLDTGRVNGLYPAGTSFAVGSGFAMRAPVRGRARFDSTCGFVSGAAVRRERVRQFEVRFPSDGAILAGTLTLPVGGGRHPAVAFVQGSGPTTRSYLPDLQALLVRSGVAVLAYDKRGIGQSGGLYPGESPSPQAIDALARDAVAAVRFLDRQPEIDGNRVGLAGHSQAGWIMPLAASRDPSIRFVVAFSGPAVTTDETDRYQTLTGQGEQPQLLSDAEVDAQVLAGGRSGVDPIPWIRALRNIPVLWLYGGLDKHIPARLSVRRLEALAHDPAHDFTIRVFPNANHALIATRTGLTSEMLRSDRFAPGLFPTVTSWLRRHGYS